MLSLYFIFRVYFEYLKCSVLRALGVLPVVVVVPTLTRIIKSVVTGQAPGTLELRNTPEKKNTNQRRYTHTWYITADAIHASTRSI